MAKILYGVAGQGFGHSSRAHLTADYLLKKGHEVIFAASMKSYDYLGKYFPGRMRRVFGLSLVYKNGSLSPVGTVIRNCSNAPEGLRNNKALFAEMKQDFQPDLVISDYEPFTAHWAKKSKTPCVTIDHQSTMTCLKLDKIPGGFISRLLALGVTKAYYPGIKDHIIINFFKAPTVAPRGVLSPPVIRTEVSGREPVLGEHIIFYTTDLTLRNKMMDLFGSFPERNFLIYGYNQEMSQNNCVFRKTSTEGFLDDLSMCKGVIATAGFSLISECLHFRKKMLLLPVRGQYEQMVNAYYIDKLGMGVNADKLEEESLRQFLNTLEDHSPENERILWPDNERYFRILNSKIEELISLKAPTASFRTRT